MVAENISMFYFKSRSSTRNSSAEHPEKNVEEHVSSR